MATRTTRTQAEGGIQAVGSGSLADGVNIGPYQVVRFLGRGGMGEVYEVVHTLLGKRFALKLISKELSQDEKARNLFRREGREAGNLDHSNIVRVDDCGEVEGRMYLRMELIEGRSCRGATCVTLTDYIIASSLRVPPEEAVPILHDILRGLHYAHSRRRVHRDIKPSNILLAAEAAKIGDFGLVMSGARPGGDMSQMSEVVVMGLGAQSMMNATQASGASAAAGTPDYMAPELLTGAVEANYSTDVYSVGILLLEMLTGSRRVGAAKPSQLLRSYYKLDPWWDQLYERSTAYHEDRFANAGEMLSFFTEVSGLAKGKDPSSSQPQQMVLGPATTRLAANWGNKSRDEQPSPPEGEAPGAEKGPPAALPVAYSPIAPGPVSGPPRAAGPASAPVDRRGVERAATSLPVAKAKRAMPWVPLGVGGAAVVLGASLYLVTRPASKPAGENTFRATNKQVGAATVAGQPKDETNTDRSKPVVAGETNETGVQKNSSIAVGSEKSGAARSLGVGPTSNSAKPRLVQQDDLRRQQELAVVDLLQKGQLEAASQRVADQGSLVGDELRKSVLRAHQAEKQVANIFPSGNLGRLNESLEAWKKAKPDQMRVDPEVIRKATEFVQRATSEGESQRIWREQVRTAIGDEDVPGIRRLLAEKRYETDPSRSQAEKAIQRVEATSEGFRGQARDAIKKGDLSGARLARESLNQHLARTKQEPDSQLIGEISSAQTAILERKVAAAVAELDRYMGGESSPPVTTDPEVTGNPRYRGARQSALQRQAQWKDANPPKSAVAPLPVTPPPRPVSAPTDQGLADKAGVSIASAGVTPPTVSEPQAAADTPTTPSAASGDKVAFETLKNRIKGLGNKQIPNPAKLEMVSFLQSYQKNHPEDAKEASKLVENLKNR